MEELSPLYSKQDPRLNKRYDAPKWAAVSVVALASLLTFLMLGIVRLLVEISR